MRPVLVALECCSCTYVECANSMCQVCGVRVRSFRAKPALSVEVWPVRPYSVLCCYIACVHDVVYACICVHMFV